MDHPLFDYRRAFSNLLNLKLHGEHNCYLGLPNEEWAVKIMVNLVNNHLSQGDDEKQRDLIVQAQAAYM